MVETPTNWCWKKKRTLPAQVTENRGKHQAVLDLLLKKSLPCLLALLACVLASFSSGVPMGRQDGPQLYVLPTAPLQLRESIFSPRDVVEVLVIIWLEELRPPPWRGWRGEAISPLWIAWRVGREWFPREAGLAETPKCSVGRLAQRS